jgi:cell division septum initiation protein DivIVA
MNFLEVINIASKFDAKGFKQAETATQKLNNSVKTLGKTFGVTFGTAAVIAYGKASVKAFIEDDNAARSLGITLKNLGLETGNTSAYVNDMISNLEKQTGVLDDQLRPAMDRLLRATSSVSKATTLLGLALDISAGTGKDLTTVSQGLQKAYLGNNASLGRLGVGLSKAELTSSSFEQIQIRLAELFAGQASSAAESYAGQLNKLTIAGNNAKEVIGKGIVQALTESSGSFNNATSDIEKFSEAVSNLIVDFGRLIRFTNAVPTIFELLTDPVTAIKNFNKVADLIDAQIAAQNAAVMGKNPIQSGNYLKNQTKITKLTKEEAAAQAKILANKKLSAAIDKANLALLKSGDVFEMDKIQIAAALTNQAEQLGKATSAAQLFQIANDTARLNVKKSILALEDAIASKDEAAIIAATNKLNADLKILGALGLQDIKLKDIKSILDSLKPKDLINLANLDAAIAKLNAMNAITGQPKISGAGSAGGVSSSGIPVGDFVPTIPTSGVSIGAILEFADAATARANAMAALIEAQNAADAAAFANSSLNNFNITIQTGVGDPNAIAETLDQYLQGAVDRGTLRLR